MRLSIVLFDGFTALDIVGGYEVLANVPGVEVEFIAAKTGLVNADTRRLALLGAAGALQGKQVTTNWFARERVAAYGAQVMPTRYQRDGKLITGAGVSASIDAGLYLASLIAGDEVAKTIQLGIEYYPDPPFGNGTPDTASVGAQAMVRMFEETSAERIEELKTPY